MKRNFLIQFLDKISAFPSWLKEIIYNRLSEEINEQDNLSYVFASYRPVLSYNGRCELDFKKSGFDTNIYNILEAADSNYSISEITLNTYMSLEEVAGYFLFCMDEGYFEIPDDSRILNIAGFLSGKYRTGEYFVNTGVISEAQLGSAVKDFENSNENKRFGQFLIDWGLISKQQLDSILTVKIEAKKRFVLDYNEVPTIKKDETSDIENRDAKIETLEKENKQLKNKLEQLLMMVKKND